MLLRKMQALHVVFCVEPEETLLADKHAKITPEKERINPVVPRLCGFLSAASNLL